jgi:hypothetical protein
LPEAVEEVEDDGVAPVGTFPWTAVSTADDLDVARAWDDVGDFPGELVRHQHVELETDH